MCFATAALAFSAIGATTQALGSYEQGQATAKEAKYNATVASNNAAYASASGSEQATEESMRGAQELGYERNAMAGHGIDVNSGTALKIQQSVRGASRVSTQNVENNAEMTAYGYRDQASLDTEEASQAETAGDIGAVGDLLSGANSVSTKWLGMQQSANPSLSVPDYTLATTLPSIPVSYPSGGV